MRRSLIGVAAVALIFSLALAGCTKKAASSQEAISNVKSMQTMQEKIDYLTAQAKAFYNSEEYQQAIDIAQYILARLDNNCAQAKDILAKAREQLKAAVNKTSEDVKNKINVFGK